MIDPNAPMELDDGTPVEFLRLSDEDDRLAVSVLVPSGQYRRDGRAPSRGPWLYYLDNGEWIADPRNLKKRLQNVYEEVIEEDWS